MSDDLVERVVQAMWMADVEPYDPTNRIPFEQAPESVQAYCRAEARAAIALALEEAAKVVDSMAEDLAREFEPSPSIAWVREKAAAIRAMIQKEEA